MKCAKLVMFFALALLVTTSSAARLVKSKLGDIDVTSEKGGGKVVCTASFNDELSIVIQCAGLDRQSYWHIRPR